MLGPSAVLNPTDIIAGSRIQAHPGFYVIGCFDTRITFYSQQVRALELTHALQHEHLIRANARIAVIGGGAAGLTAAAGLALQPGTNVRLFERSDVLLPLQRDSQRRRLDPHIYEWPKPDADHELAELPLLDWRSGSAIEVRTAVLQEFTNIRMFAANRLEVSFLHDVTRIQPQHGRFILSFTREGANGDRVEDQAEYDIVILAVGFGTEPSVPIGGTVTPSYWRDAGVPGPEITGKARPAFLVSGNGDGGLIDLIAAASRNFDHNEIIRGIAQRPGVRDLGPRLLEIDRLARENDAQGQGFDFIAAYDASIGADVEALGLVGELRGRLRPGVQLFFQTREQDLLSIRTARLNRLAVYLLTKACTAPQRFVHLVCPDFVALSAIAGAPQANFRFDCGGQEIEVDQVIARRGPNQAAVRHPFADLLEGFEAEHKAWITAFPEDGIAPVLGQSATSYYQRLAREAQLPPPRYRLAAVEAALPLRIKLALDGDQVRWSGDLGLDAFGAGWAPETAHIELMVTATPQEVGDPLAHAVARFAVHAPRVTLFLDVAQWRTFLEKASTRSPHASDFMLPSLRALGRDASILNLTVGAPDEVAARLHGAMNRWLLESIDSHVSRYLAHGDDPGHAVSIVAAADLRAQMRPIWGNWQVAFAGDPVLLARFLNLAICARDDVGPAWEATVLAGPRLLSSLIRVCAAGLAVATAWQTTAPRGIHPGNLGRATDASTRTGHACGAALIEGEEMAIAALQHMWSTDFVLLPMQALPPVMLSRANASLARSGSGALSLTDVGDGRLMLTLDRTFRAAAEAGLAPLADLLQSMEEQHFAALQRSIDREPVDGDPA